MGPASEGVLVSEPDFIGLSDLHLRGSRHVRSLGCLRDSDWYDYRIRNTAVV
jgi:hypothetical protein